MASRKIEEKLDRLSSLREADRTEAIAALRTALADRANVVVAKSAKITGKASTPRRYPGNSSCTI